jgi:CheY-like chemotaxis protein
MSISHGSQPFMALVDDDPHSARLMIRMLLAHGAPSVSWLPEVDAATAEFTSLMDMPRARLPGLVIVDLKASSAATADFVAMLRSHPAGRCLRIVAMAASLERDVRDALLASGADAVFERRADLDAYRQEAASIVGFWVRHQRLDAVGT